MIDSGFSLFPPHFAHDVNWNGGCRFGTIISTKAILDKNTNKCKGYGFVDFESPSAAESAVKALQLQGIQAQMAKVIVKVINPLFYFLFSFFQCLAWLLFNHFSFHLQSPVRQQQEQDPTNLYLANLPAHITEQDLHEMLYKYGTVISTRVLRDGGSQSRGVGFARSAKLFFFSLSRWICDF